MASVLTDIIVNNVGKVYIDGEQIENSLFVLSGLVMGLGQNDEVIITIKCGDTTVTTQLQRAAENKIDVTNFYEECSN